MNRTRPRALLAGLGLAALVLAGCGPSQEEIITSSDNVHAQTFTLAEQATQTARDLNPDLTLNLSYDARRDDRWYDCSDTPRADTQPPKVIMWIDDRWLYVDPPRETASLIDPIVAAFVADGWTAGNDSLSSTSHGGRVVYLRKGGYTLSLGGETELIEGYTHSLTIHVFSPCVTAPDNLLDWKYGDIPPMPTSAPTDADAPPGTLAQP
ncbi:hypothetical protein [Cellulomonas hominis]